MGLERKDEMRPQGLEVLERHLVGGEGKEGVTTLPSWPGCSHLQRWKKEEKTQVVGERVNSSWDRGQTLSEQEQEQEKGNKMATQRLELAWRMRFVNTHFCWYLM